MCIKKRSRQRTEPRADIKCNNIYCLNQASLSFQLRCAIRRCASSSHSHTTRALKHNFFFFYLSFFLSFFLFGIETTKHTQSPHHKYNTKTPTQTHTHIHTREIRPKEQRDTRTPITPIVAYRPRLSLSCLRSFSSVQSFSLFIVRSLSFVDLLLTVHTFFLLLFFFVKKFSKMSTQERHRLGLSLAVLVMLNLK